MSDAYRKLPARISAYMGARTYQPSVALMVAKALALGTDLAGVPQEIREDAQRQLARGGSPTGKSPGFGGKSPGFAKTRDASEEAAAQPRTQRPPPPLRPEASNQETLEDQVASH